MFNEATLIGRLGQNPEIKHKAGEDDEFAIASVATTRTWKNASGEKQEATEWHRLVFFRKLAQIAKEHLKKGALIWVRGPIQTRKWADDSGTEHYSTQIVVNEIRMLGKPAAKDEPEAGTDADAGAESASMDAFVGD
ncbi:MAG: single-stranded DNA-binding protein [Burkholderiaceae bacterium]|jgi:single-strand DNA-binding protein|nr:single-stranded DNA-binding protein [Burkholderiaceae bacterium]